MSHRLLSKIALAALTSLFAGCSSMYYSALERIGIEKREILVDRLESARDAQGEAQKQFKDALDQFKALVGYDGGDLESMYTTLSDVYEDSTKQAQLVRDRVAAVKEVARSLFREWESELSEYSDPKLKRQSQRQLDDTRNRFNKLAAMMDRAAASMDPVLTSLHDQVLFLKHNLNARAIGSLSETVGGLQTDVSRLVQQMEVAIEEANRFIASMKPE